MNSLFKLQKPASAAYDKKATYNYAAEKTDCGMPIHV